MNIMKKESVGSKARTESPYNGGPKDPTDRNGAVALLRLCATLLAAVSFWATAQGMKAYVFSQRWQAYAASLAVQGILLGLNFYLPSFWRAAKENAVKALLLGLSFVVLFCSSWFSFVYIVGQVYGDSWDIESQLLVQSAYRKAVYDGGDYAREYQEVLNEDLRQRITSLSSRARSLGNQTVVVNPYNWEEERLIYTAEDFSARSTMRTVIDAMERSMKDASPSVREQAADILITMRGVLEDEIESLTAQISSTSEAIVDANQSIRTAQNRVTSAPAGTDLAGLISQADQATAYAERLQTTLQEQQDKLEDYREAVSQVRFYQASLGHAGGGPVNLVSASLRNIQQELFREQPDLARLETLAVDVFQQLQSAMDAETENTFEEEEVTPNEQGSAPSGDEDTTQHDETQDTYQQLLLDMDNFIQELRNYRALKSASTQFDAMLEELRAVSVTQQNPALADRTENSDEPSETGDPNKPSESETPTVPDTLSESEEPTVTGTPSEEVNSSSLSAPEDEDLPTEDENSIPKVAEKGNSAAPMEWKETWLVRLDNLKSVISGLPAYSGNELLLKYSRAASADALDEVIRKYIADHNAVQQGLIYLESPYNEVAVFSLLLAFFLDIAAFVTGMVIDIVETKREEDWKESPKNSLEVSQQKEPDHDSWEPPVGLTRYIYLNGDFQREKGTCYYQGIEDGVETWTAFDSVENTLTEKPWLYIRQGKNISPVAPQELMFMNEKEGPRDGVYFDCILIYDEGLLSIQVGEETELRNLSTVEKDLTIYQLSEDGCEIFPIKYLKQQIWKTAVIALNQRGTSIAAVYLL